VTGRGTKLHNPRRRMAEATVCP